MYAILVTSLTETRNGDNFSNQPDGSWELGLQLETPGLADPQGSQLSHGEGPVPAALVN